MPIVFPVILLIKFLQQVERVFKLHESGEFVKGGPFSEDSTMPATKTWRDGSIQRLVDKPHRFRELVKDASRFRDFVYRDAAPTRSVTAAAAMCFDPSSEVEGSKNEDTEDEDSGNIKSSEDEGSEDIDFSKETSRNNNKRYNDEVRGNDGCEDEDNDVDEDEDNDIDEDEDGIDGDGNDHDGGYGYPDGGYCYGGSALDVDFIHDQDCGSGYGRESGDKHSDSGPQKYNIEHARAVRDIKRDLGSDITRSPREEEVRDYPMERATTSGEPQS